MNCTEQLTQSLFKKNAIEECSLHELQSLVRHYPYFAVGHFLLAEKIKTLDNSLYNHQLEKASLYFHNPLWLDYVLNKDQYNQQEGGLIIDKQEEFQPDQVNGTAESVDEIVEDTPSLKTQNNKSAFTEDQLYVPGIFSSELQTVTDSQLTAIKHSSEDPFDTQEELEKISPESSPKEFSEEILTEEKIEDAPSLKIQNNESAYTEGQLSVPGISSSELPTATDSQLIEIKHSTENSFNTQEELEKISPESSRKEFSEEILTEDDSDKNPETSTSLTQSTTEKDAEQGEVINLELSPERHLNEEEQLVQAQHESEIIQSQTEGDNAIAQAEKTAFKLPALKIEPLPETNNDLLFEPYHTVDYFASQGIKPEHSEKPLDRFGQQLKSFTEWLKTMKRLPEKEISKKIDARSEQKVQTLAEHSIEDKFVVTETMAEVWIKQGDIQKAIEVYDKLSLRNPSKSRYFAAKIEKLKND